MGVFIDDVDIDRIQTIGSSTRYNDQDLRELGTLNIVEVVEDIPTIDVTIDTNEYGSNKTLASLCGKGYGCRVFAVPSGTYAGSARIHLEDGSVVNNGVRIPVVAADIDLSQPGEYYLTIKTDPKANPQYTITPVPSGLPTGEIPICQFVVPSGTLRVTQDLITDLRDFKEIKVLDFELAKADIYVPVISSGSTTIDRTMYMEDVYVNRIDLSYNSDGIATENYSAETDNKRWFLNAAKNIVCEQFKATSGQSSYTLAYTPAQLNDGSYILKAIKNGQEFTEFTVNPTTKTVTFSPALTLGDQVKLRYCAAEGGQFHSQDDEMVSESYEHPGGVRQGHVKVYLTEGGTDNVLTRAQSVRITGTLTRETLRELGKLAPYDRPLNIPVEITSTLEFTDSDLEVLARLSGKSYTEAQGVDPNVKELNVRDLLKDRGLLVEIYRLHDEDLAKLPDNHPYRYPLKKVRIPYLIPTGENWETRVEGNATQTFDFRSFDLRISA